MERATVPHSPTSGAVAVPGTSRPAEFNGAKNRGFSSTATLDEEPGGTPSKPTAEMTQLKGGIGDDFANEEGDAPQPGTAVKEQSRCER